MNEKEYVYDANIKHSDKSSKKYLLICHMFKTITSIFISTFLIGHIYTFSGNIFDYTFNVAVFNIFVYLSNTLSIRVFIAAKVFDIDTRSAFNLISIFL